MTDPGALPVARVAVDTGLAHLDRPFDYRVPDTMADTAVPGCRVRVRFAGRLVDGFVLERAASSEHGGRLSPLASVVSPEPVLSPEIAELSRALADRNAGSLSDVLRLAIPPRHARVEAEAPRAFPEPAADDPDGWSDYENGPGYLSALAAGKSPRAVWTALPGSSWPRAVAGAVAACAASGRGAVVVVPDARDLARVAAALRGIPHVELSADAGPAERYRRWLAVRRGQVSVVAGTRAAAFAPVADLGLVVVWDDGDDLHAEPRAPYVHVREVLVLRAHLAGAAALLGGHARTAEGQLLVESGWARAVGPRRTALRTVQPRVRGVSDADLARDPLAQRARLPAAAFEAARAALAADAPVLVQVPRRGHSPALACAADRMPARCPECGGPLGADTSAVPSCRWCGRLAGTWRCPRCGSGALRAVVVGAARTAVELGRAFPQVPVRTSGRGAVLASVPDTAALVVATPGAEPVAPSGYGAVLLLDGWSLLGRADLRAGEEALRRWFAAAALGRPAAPVVVVADSGIPQVQALIRWDPAGAAARELADRSAVGFPPACRMASVVGPPAAVAEMLAEIESPPGTEVLGPVPVDEARERVLLRVPRPRGLDLAAAVKAVVAVRSARKAETLRVEFDPVALT